MNTELESIVKRADDVMAIGRKITNAANVHDLNCHIGYVMNGKQLIQWYDEKKNIAKYNEWVIKLNDYIERLTKMIEKEIAA